MAVRRFLCWLTGLSLVGTLTIGVNAAPAEVAAKSAFLVDVTTGTVLYEQNAHEDAQSLALPSRWRQQAETGTKHRQDRCGQHALPVPRSPPRHSLE